MVELGWCGFGASGGLVPEMRLGLVRVAVTRGSVVERLQHMFRALSDAADELCRGRRPKIVPAPPPASERAP